ncbi:MAG: hypothetical protein IPL78_36215 [Chloroflexi bacterium]|nr:hypothetical protein [Chloroflexota bacterium]
MILTANDGNPAEIIAAEIVAGHGTITLLEGQPQVICIWWWPIRTWPRPPPIVVLAGHASRTIALRHRVHPHRLRRPPVHHTCRDRVGVNGICRGGGEK